MDPPRSFAALRMTERGLRMTERGLRMTERALRMTSPGTGRGNYPAVHSAIPRSSVAARTGFTSTATHPAALHRASVSGSS